MVENLIVMIRYLKSILLIISGLILIGVFTGYLDKYFVSIACGFALIAFILKLRGKFQ